MNNLERSDLHLETSDLAEHLLLVQKNRQALADLLEEGEIRVELIELEDQTEHLDFSAYAA